MSKSLITMLLAAVVTSCGARGTAGSPAATQPTTRPSATTMTANATPQEAFDAYLGAMLADDRELLRDLVLLPDDPERRKWVLDVIDKALGPPRGATVVKRAVTMDGPVAVCEGEIRLPDGSVDDSSPMFFVKRHGRWYFVIDYFEGGGLTQDELDAVSRNFR